MSNWNGEERRNINWDVIIERIHSMEMSISGLASKFDGVQKSIDKLDNRMMLQNGRVTKLELWTARLIGALIIMSLLMAPILNYMIPEMLKSYGTDMHEKAVKR